MRIRKRAVPLPLSFSDRLLHLSADRLAASVSPAFVELKGYGDDEKNHGKVEGNNHTGGKERSDTGAVSDNGAVLPPTPSNLTPVASTEGGRWCEGDKAMPFKKRKVVSLEFDQMSKIGVSSTKMKSKTNKNCSLHHTSSDSSDDNEDEKSKKKKSKKGKLGGKYSSKEGRVLMEGSRCSRVNGRGWRCLQPTLVGYSLCEHHLGKGRLKSISAVRVKQSTAPPASSTPPRASESKIISISDDEEAGGGKKKKKKKRKVGMVKARSLSSLLCQPETKMQLVHPAS